MEINRFQCSFYRVQILSNKIPFFAKEAEIIKLKLKEILDVSKVKIRKVFF